MTANLAAWLIIILPLASGLLTLVLIRPWTPRLWVYSPGLNIAAVLGSLTLSIWLLLGFDPHHPVQPIPIDWLTLGDADGGSGFIFRVGVLIDGLSLLMAAVVSGVSLLVHVYSVGYMRKDETSANGEWSDYPRYFAYLAIFTSAMLGLVFAFNLIQMFVFWELVGLFSYLLIGFWFHRPAAAAAAKKAFIITRIGDFGFLLGLLFLFFNRDQVIAAGANPFEIPDLLRVVGQLNTEVVTWVALGLFAGAVGKSAQFPLNTWLPDAMEGPTPVSSLIHAATMVAAGVFLVARMFDLFAASEIALNTVALIGGLTAVMAAAMGLVNNDIKRVLAFSTVSQLGYMFVALGLGAPAVAMFHLFTHAFFKCLLFLGAGSVHHSVHTFDMRYMGGLRRFMPITYVTTLIAGLSLAGVFPLAGFWSKDEILAVAWAAESPANPIVSKLVFWLALGAAFMTAFYVFRMIYMTFHGEFRGGIDAVPANERIPDESELHVHKSDAPWVMLSPMIALAVFALFAGVLANSLIAVGPVSAHWLTHLLGAAAHEFNLSVAVGSSALVLIAILLATSVYRRGNIYLEPANRPYTTMHRWLTQRFYMDHLYEGFIVRKLAYRGIFFLADWLDRWIVDGFVDFIGWTNRNGSKAIAQLQTGQLQA